MEHLSSLPTKLTELAVGLLSTNDDADTRSALGDLLGRIAASVNTMAEGIHANRHASQACAEIDQHIDKLHALVLQKAGEPAARRLTFWLKNASSVSASYKADIGKLIVSEVEPNRWSAVRRSEHSHLVQQVAGTLRAVGNLVRLQPG